MRDDTILFYTVLARDIRLEDRRFYCGESIGTDEIIENSIWQF